MKRNYEHRGYGMEIENKNGWTFFYIIDNGNRYNLDTMLEGSYRDEYEVCKILIDAYADEQISRKKKFLRECLNFSE